MKSQILLIAIAVLLLSIPKLSLSQAPNLGSAASFVLFTTTGAVSNTGISQITGDVGTNGGGSVTSFGNVDGVMHNGDAVTALCASDLLTAYTQLNAAVPTFFPGPVLGNGTTLTAGVYSLAAAASLNTTLTLDGQGNANAVFIFQVGGAFSANASSQLILINGATACNVFWKVEGLVSAAAGAVLRGTFIANNAAIALGAGVTLEGRALSTTGAVSVYNLLANTPIGCGTPVLAGPIAPVLASLACFSLFSSQGAVTNSGISFAIGDIGTNAGVTSGFIPADVTGIIHPVPDGYTAVTATDLLNVYSYLNTLPADIELLYPAQFGNDLTLTAHTYVMNAAALLTGNLYLNANGNAGAVFVIQVNGALSTSANANVILINGALPGNVYWKVEGAVTINSNSNFTGVIVSNNGAINLTAGDILNGRAFATNGVLNSAAIMTDMASPGCTLLPVTWLYFRGEPIQAKVLLEWGVANEVNTGYFTLEKGMDGHSFQILTTVNAVSGISPAASDYSFTDPQPSSPCYYRISQTDINGQINYDHIIEVETGQRLKVVNYVDDSYINIQVSGATPGNGSIELYSMDGRRISSAMMVLTKEQSTYKIVRPLSKGIYLLFIASQGEKLYDGKVSVL